MADVTDFGVTSAGIPVRKITLRAGDLTASILTWGAVLQSVRLNGVGHDLTLGSDLLADYEGDMRYHGSLVAPVVNRLTDARATIAGKKFTFEANTTDGNCLHSGSAGTHLKLWHLVRASDSEAVLAVDLADGEGGFPGNRHVEARFIIAPDATLRMEITATTDAPTLFNAANHSYWNLDGSTNWAGHSLQVMADAYLPTTSTFIATGEIRDVSSGSYDFRDFRAITPDAPAIDTYFCVRNAQGPLQDVMQLKGQSGLTLRIATTEAGVQIYDGRYAIRPACAPYEGIAIEAHGWPDAPNHAGFPSIELMPGKALCQVTQWQFVRP